MSARTLFGSPSKGVHSSDCCHSPLAVCLALGALSCSHYIGFEDEFDQRQKVTRWTLRVKWLPDGAGNIFDVEVECSRLRKRVTIRLRRYAIP